MELFIEKKQCITGVARLDKDHKRLAERFNEMYHDATNNKNNPSKMFKMDIFLYETQCHFAFEEEVMEEINYPDTQKHKDEHIKLMNELSCFLTQSNANSLEILEYIRAWLLNHFSEQDVLLANYINDNNIQLSDIKFEFGTLAPANISERN